MSTAPSYAILRAIIRAECDGWARRRVTRSTPTVPTRPHAVTVSSPHRPDASAVAGCLVLLGTGTSVGVPVIGCHCDVCTSDEPKNKRTRTGVAVLGPAGNFLIDTSQELRLQLIRERIDDVEAVVYTHAHADHVFGLDDLRIFGVRKHRPVPLYCEENVERHIRRSFYYAFQPSAPDAHVGATPQLEFRRITTEPFVVCGWRVQPIRLLHGRLPILGFRIGDIAFCTDVSAIPDSSWALLEGLRVLILGALRDRPHPTHFSVGQALDVIDRVQPQQAYLTHLSHQLDYREANRRLPERVSLAYDGLRIPLSDAAFEKSG
ncbi:MAG: MBL fold metallo-hydrolase [Planctomycetota bacterium]|nr:MAG: MBL fold metallo-hydrolase [Planctomycetota bacterium]